MLFGLIGGRNRERGELRRAGSHEERRELALRHGYNGMSFLTLYPGWEYFHPVQGAGYIAFERHNRTALAVGDPICAPEDTREIIEAFRGFCAAERLTPAFAGSTERLAEICHAEGWKVLKIGEEPIFGLAGYAPRGNRTKKVRSAANQARKGGVTVDLLTPGTSPGASLALEMLDVQAAWQATRNIKALSFTLRLAPLEHADDKLILLARKAGRLEGFVTCIPIAARNGYYFEDMIRRPDAPNGVSEMLFLAAVEACRERGAEMANLGLAPLRNARSQRWGHSLAGGALQFTFAHLNLFYKFKPLEHFKAKFGPDGWEDAYLIYRPGRLTRVSLALLSAFTPGKLGPFAAAISRFRKPAQQRAPGRRWSPGHAAGMATTAGIAAACGALAVQDPALFAPIERTFDIFSSPVIHAGEAARAHIFIDSVVLLAAGGWYARSARRN